MTKAVCSSIDNDKIYCEIPELSGIWATGDTLEHARCELKEVVEGWIELGLRLDHQIPAIDGVSTYTSR